MAGGLPKDLLVPAGESRSFEVHLTLGESADAFRHQLRAEFSTGKVQTVEVWGRVLRGVVVAPTRLSLEAQEPLAMPAGELQLSADDNTPFHIRSATLDLPGTADVDDARHVVSVRLCNDNRHTLLNGTLSVHTDHPKRSVVHVPVIATLKVTWELSPPAVFLHGIPAETQVERTVQLRSTLELPFTVESTSGPDGNINPTSPDSLTDHELRVVLLAPRVAGKVERRVVMIRTSLPDAREIELPVVFYP